MKKIYFVTGLLALGFAFPALADDPSPSDGCRDIGGKMGVISCASVGLTVQGLTTTGQGISSSMKASTNLSKEKQQNRQALFERALPYVSQAKEKFLKGEALPEPFQAAYDEVKREKADATAIEAIQQIVQETRESR